ncbi:RNA-directed DNA polymerase, eukaryota, reverse transcriptase zinc-binding domain protein [Tanacetum coccineum]
MESNQSLLAKWWWRFRVEENSIWRKVIRSIHGPTGGMLNPFDLKQSSGTWSQIVNLKDDLNSIGINLPLLFKKKIGNGKSMRFWHDNWLGGKTLREAFMLLYQLETKKDCYVFERHGSVVQNSHTSHDSIQVLGPISQPIISRINDGLVTPWAWRKRTYSLAQILELTDLQNLLTDLPTKANLDKRGIDLDSVLCPMCNNDIEMESHILVSYPTAQAVWKDIFTWWKLSNSHLSALEDVFSLTNRAPLEKCLTSFFDVTVNTTMWPLWDYRNKVIFNLKGPQKELILNEIKLSTFNWISSRSKKTFLLVG